MEGRSFGVWQRNFGTADFTRQRSRLRKTVPAGARTQLSGPLTCGTPFFALPTSDQAGRVVTANVRILFHFKNPSNARAARLLLIAARFAKEKLGTPTDKDVVSG